MSKQINYNDKEAARFVENIKGWVDINGRFFGDGKEAEHMARYSSCTHKTCKCGEVFEKGWTICPKCREKKDSEMYNALQFKEYDGSPVYSKSIDRYFFSEEEIMDFINDEEDGFDLQLVFCNENHYNELDGSYFEDVLPDDCDFPDELQNAIDNFNEVIKNLPAASYSPSNVRTTYFYAHNERNKSQQSLNIV